MEARVKESPPIPAVRDDALVPDYDARFQAARERFVRVCAGLVGTDAAEDVVHDAYLRGRSRFGQLRDPALFDAWLMRIAINLCLNRRRRGRTLRAVLGSIAHRVGHEPQDVGLRELIERLPSRERTIVVLHYGYGYQLDEIARMSGLSAGNVRSIAFRARRRLRGALDEADR